MQENKLVSLYTSSSLDDDDKQWVGRLAEEVEKITAYKFKNPHLLHQAFTHSSFQSNCASYERLEYIAMQENKLVSLYTSSSLDDDDKQWVGRLAEEVEKITAYKFKNPHLLHQAFTHSSFQSNCASYERLEYIGDSVLNVLIAMEHYINYPDLSPGKLTRLRAANVDTEKLARVAIKYKLHNYLRHKKPLLKEKVEEFKEAILEYPLHSVGLIDPPKILADIIKSLIGVIYIDSNSSMDITRQVVKDLLEPLITLEKLEVHPVTKIYELCQKNGLRVEFVDQWKKTGEIQIFVDGKFVGKGSSSGRKITAQNRAAHNAYNQVVRNLIVKATIDDDEQLCDETQS